MIKQKCKITFITHGATIYTEDSRFCSQLNYPPLEENGQQEIRQICKYLKNRGVKNDKIYSGPAIRCVRSAEIISKMYKQDFEILPELISRNWGDWNGMTAENIIKKYAFTYNETFPSIIALTPENGEAITDFNKRIDDIIKNIVAENIGNRVIVVTGQNVVQSVIATALNISPEMQSRICIKTGSATQINYFNGWSNLMYSNYVPL